MWVIEYFSDKVASEILELPPPLLARYLHYVESMEEFGANLGMPHTRAMGEGLFELRIKSDAGIARVFFCTMIGKRIVVVHSFVKKSQKTPQREMETARRRLKEVRQG